MFEGDARTRWFQNLPTSVNRSCKGSTGLKTRSMTPFWQTATGARIATGPLHCA